MNTQNTLYHALEAACKTNKLVLAFAELFGEKAELVQGERRFETRRLGATTYLIGERRSEDRRVKRLADFKPEDFPSTDPINLDNIMSPLEIRKMMKADKNAH